jgi:hypothetical protein
VFGVLAEVVLVERLVLFQLKNLAVVAALVVRTLKNISTQPL